MSNQELCAFKKEISISRLTDEDFAEFSKGIEDRNLRIMYGLSVDMSKEKEQRVFTQFCNLPKAFSINYEGHSVGFLLDVEPEVPQEMTLAFDGNGRTLAFAIYPNYQRRGIMKSILRMYINELFDKENIKYIHCGHFDYNDASAQLLAKLGFIDIGSHKVKDRTILDKVILHPNS